MTKAKKVNYAAKIKQHESITPVAVFINVIKDELDNPDDERKTTNAERTANKQHLKINEQRTNNN